jgi:hypothetical protein
MFSSSSTVSFGYCPSAEQDGCDVSPSESLAHASPLILPLELLSDVERALKPKSRRVLVPCVKVPKHDPYRCVIEETPISEWYRGWKVPVLLVKFSKMQFKTVFSLLRDIAGIHRSSWNLGSILPVTGWYTVGILTRKSLDIKLY